MERLAEAAPGGRTRRRLNATFDIALDTQADAEELSAALELGHRRQALRGDGSCSGRTDLRIGTVIEISGVGKVFEGPFYLTSVSHSLVGGQGFSTGFVVRAAVAR